MDPVGGILDHTDLIRLMGSVNEREHLGSCVLLVASEVFWLFRQTVWCFTCSFRQMSWAVWECGRTNPSDLKLKHCTAKQTKSSHNVKTESRFIDQKLSLVFLNLMKEDYMKSTEVQN